MFGGKKGRMMRHPYAMLALVGLATAGALVIGGKVKGFVSEKVECAKYMMKNMKRDY